MRVDLPDNLIVPLLGPASSHWFCFFRMAALRVRANCVTVLSPRPLYAGNETLVLFLSWSATMLEGLSIVFPFPFGSARASYDHTTTQIVTGLELTHTKVCRASIDMGVRASPLLASYYGSKSNSPLSTVHATPWSCLLVQLSTRSSFTTQHGSKP